MNGKRLLLVDDLPDMGRIVERVAEQLGYEVQVTTHGKEFMQVYDSFNPTTVFLDIVMPGIDGIELIGWLNRRKCSAEIFVASAFNPKYAELAEKLGAAKGLDISYIVKPFRIADLRAVLAP